MNISHWRHIDQNLLTDQSSIQQLLTSALFIHNTEMTRMAKLKPTVSEREYRVLESHLRYHMIRVEAIK